jgi:Anti-sigma-28 factor, FlgM
MIDLKMALTLHITPPEHLDELVDKAVSPLDQELGTIECSDPELTPTRTRNVMRMRTRLAAGDYVVDADAVADAIIERLRPAGPVSWLQARAV